MTSQTSDQENSELINGCSFKPLSLVIHYTAIDNYHKGLFKILKKSAFCHRFMNAFSFFCAPGLEGPCFHLVDWKHIIFFMSKFILKMSEVTPKITIRIPWTHTCLLGFHHASSHHLPAWNPEYKYHAPWLRSIKKLIQGATANNRKERKLFSHVWPFATLWTMQSMEFSRPEYWIR